MKKRMISIILILAIQLMMIPNVLAQTDTATATFGGSSATLSGFSTAKMVSESGAVVQTVGGKACWVLDIDQGEKKAAIDLTLSNDFKSVSAFDGSVYDVEIEYYDTKALSFFCLYYDSLDNSKKLADIVYTQNSGAWKKATFTLDDALFNKRLDESADLSVSLMGPKAWEYSGTAIGNVYMGKNSIPIRSVKVTRKNIKNVLKCTAEVTEPGNAYKWYSNEKEFKTFLSNVTDQAITADIEYKLINEETSEVLWTYNETRTVNANDTIRTVHDFGNVKKCGLYRIEVDIETSSGLTLNTQTPAKIAIVKADENGIKNEDVAYAAHFDRYAPSSITEGMEVLSMANVYGVRQDLSWRKMLSDGTLDINASPAKFVVDKVLENNMKPLGQLYDPPIDADFNWKEIPGSRSGSDGERQLQRWSDYVTYVGTQMRGKIDYFEVWNEPNHGNFNSDLENGNGYAYAKAISAAAQAMKTVNPDAVVAGPSLAGINNEFIKTTEIGGKTFFNQAMEAGMWENVSTISFHPYVYPGTPEEQIQEFENGLNYFKQAYVQKGVNPPQLYPSEAGRRTGQGNVETDKDKGALVCRQILLMKNRGLIDAPFTIYGFERSGIIDLEYTGDTYGHVSPGLGGFEVNGTLYYPNEAFLSVAGMNYVMADSEFVQDLDNNNANVYMSQYWSNKFNKDIITLYTTGSNTSVNLSLGANTVTLYDEYGNAQTLNSANGEYSIDIDGNLSYIVGNISDHPVEANVQQEPMEVRQSEVIDVFDSLQGYSKAKGKYVGEEALPKGMGILGEPWTGYKFQSIENADGTTSAGFINSDGSVYIPFEEVIATGVIHFSMDMKFVASDDGKGYFFMDYLPKEGVRGDWNPQNIWGDNELYHRAFIFRVNCPELTSIREGALLTNNQIGNQWHSVDVYIDTENKTVKFYLDGNEIDTENKKMVGEGIKALRFYSNSEGEQPTVYMDNIYVRHYKADSHDVLNGYESIKMSADFAKNGVSLENGMVRLVYSEPIAVSDRDFEPWAEDIKITRLSDGAVLTPDEDYTFEFNQRDGGVIRFLTTLEEGEYEIAQEADDTEYYGGLISGRKVLVGESTRFYTEKTNTDIDLAGERRYLIDEDFNDYTGGTPENSTEMINGWGVTTSAVSSTHTNAQDKAIKLPLDDSAAVFKFNKPIQGGKIVVEFDVKHSNSGWGVNLLKERDFLPANYLGKTHWEIGKDGSGNPVIGDRTWLSAQYDYYQTKLAEAKAADPSLDETTWRNANWVSLWSTYRTDPDNVLAMRDTDIKLSNLIYSDSNTVWTFYSPSRKQVISGINQYLLRVYQNTWTHVKIELDTTAGTYEAIIGGTSAGVKTLDKSNFASGKYGSTNDENSFAGSYNINTGEQNWTFGFGGIALRTYNYSGASSSASVEYDNLKVYMENAYNDYETFDHGRNETQSLQSWYNVLQNGPASKPERGDALNPWRSYYYTSEGRNYNAETNPTDKALAYVISPRGAGVMGHQFNVPVKAGKNFEIDFDIKIDNSKFGSETGDGKDTAFSFHLMTPDRLYTYRYEDYDNLNNATIDNQYTVIENNNGRDNWNVNYNLLFANSAIADGGSLEDTGKFRFYTGREGWDPTSSNGTVAYKDGDNSTNLYLNSKAWNHIKLSGRAVGDYYAVRLTINDVTSQEYITQIPSNQDIAAVAFKPLRTSDWQKRAIHLDNFKVTETGYSQNAVVRVNKVSGINTSEDLTNSFKVSDDSINVDFVIPNLTNDDLEYIGVRNMTKNAEADIIKTISADKRTVNIKFSTVPDIGDELKLYVNQSVGMTGSDTYLNTPLSKLKSYNKTFTVVAGNNNFEVEDIRLYRFYPEWVHEGKPDVVSPEGWHPVLTKDLSDISAENDIFKTVIRGYNGTNATKTVKFINAEYAEGILKSISITNGNIGKGLFEIVGAPVQLDDESDNIKAFVFEEDLITPVGKNVHYDVTFDGE